MTYLTEPIKKQLDGDAEIPIEGIYQGTVTAQQGDKVKIKVRIPKHDQIVSALIRQAASRNIKAIDMVLNCVEGKVPIALSGLDDEPLIPQSTVLPGGETLRF